MPREKKPKAPPSNAKAMRDILERIDASPQLLHAKTERKAWLERELLRKGAYPYIGTKKDLQGYHNADSLHEAVTYAVRDGKQDQYQTLKGEAAVARFFHLGSKMLRSEYLVAIGYEISDGAGVARVHGPNNRLKHQNAPSVELPHSRPGCTSVEHRKKHDSLSTLPHHTEEVQLSVQQDHEVVYEPVVTSPSKKRKYAELGNSATTTTTPSSGGRPPDEQNHTTTAFETELRQDLRRLRDIVSKLATNLRPHGTPLHLKSWPSVPLCRIYADTFARLGWRHVYEDLVETNSSSSSSSSITSSTLLQAVIWTFVDRHIFQKPLPGISSALRAPIDIHAVEGATQSARTTRRKDESDSDLVQIALEQLHESNDLVNTLRPAAATQAGQLTDLVTEHLAAAVADNNNSSSICPDIIPVVTDAVVVTHLQDICERALILKGKLEASHGAYRSFKHQSGWSVYHDHPSHPDQQAQVQRVVAFTIAPGIERRGSRSKVRGSRTTMAGKEIASEVVVIEAAMIALADTTSNVSES